LGHGRITDAESITNNGKAYGSVASPKQMAASPPLDIEVGVVGAADMVHNLGKIAGRRFEQQVIVVVHQTKGVNDSLVSFGGGLKVSQKLFPDPSAFVISSRPFGLFVATIDKPLF